MKTIPDQHLFTVRGRPVMFRKDEEFFGTLHAIERGFFPICHTGYYSLSQLTNDESKRTGFFDLLSENFLESIAARKERKTSEVLRDIVRCSRKDATDQNALIRCLECASLSLCVPRSSTPAGSGHQVIATPSVLASDFWTPSPPAHRHNGAQSLHGRCVLPLRPTQFSVYAYVILFTVSVVVHFFCLQFRLELVKRG